MATVTQWMTRDPVTVSRQTSLAACAAQLLERHVRHLPVVDEGGALVGVLEDEDVFAHGRVERGAFEAFPTHARLTAGDLVEPVRGIAPGTPIGEAIHRLVDTHRSFVVAVDSRDHPVGLLTEHDVLRHVPEWLGGDEDAGSILRPGTYTVRPTDPLRAAWVMLEFHGFRHLPVVDASEALVGIVSHRDLEEAHAEQDLWRAVEEVMVPAVETANRNESLRALAERMLRQKVGCIPIVERGRVVGIVTTTDILRAVLDHLEAPAT